MNTPETVTLYICDHCNVTKTYHPMNHRIPPAGPKCPGTIHAIIYVKTELRPVAD